jgi:hypothetical protein
MNYTFFVRAFPFQVKSILPPAVRVTTMIEENFARLRTHQNNIQRYRQLLETRLTDSERQFIEKRLSEERLALETLAASTFPLTGPIDSRYVALP